MTRTPETEISDRSASQPAYVPPPHEDTRVAVTPPENEEAKSPRSRRNFVTAGLAGAAALGVTRTAGAQSRPNTGTDETVESIDPVLFLVNRINCGFKLSEYRRAKQMGYEAYLEEQLNPAQIGDALLENRLASEFPTLQMTMQQLWDNYLPGQPDEQVPEYELRSEFLFRAVYSKRQLQERMVEFWSDHFNTFHGDGVERYLKGGTDGEQAAVIRQHALGNFGDMLVADAQSGAMLWYLDNYANFVGTAQENYARELMELHTVGEGNFTEQDVAEVAKCLTGWTFWDTVSGQLGHFRYIHAYHDTTEKTVMGTVIPAGGGKSDGDTVLQILKTSEHTALFLAKKMTKWLLVDNPPWWVVQRAAFAYMRTGGDIKEMIRQILGREAVMAVVNSPRGERLRFKRPQHLIVGMMRALDADIGPDQGDDITTFVLYLLGQFPFYWQAPNGYPDSIGFWGSNFLGRANMTYLIAHDGISEVNYDAVGVFQQFQGGINHAHLGKQINKLLTGGLMSKRDEQHVQNFIDGAGNFNEFVLREAIALAAAAPSYQYY